LNLPNGKSGTFYGISTLSKDRGPFMTDLPILFDLLGAGKLKPRIGATFPLLEAAQANELLESGRVNGRRFTGPELLEAGMSQPKSAGYSQRNALQSGGVRTQFHYLSDWSLKTSPAASMTWLQQVLSVPGRGLYGVHCAPQARFAH
jgi:hypothetical protein